MSHHRLLGQQQLCVFSLSGFGQFKRGMPTLPPFLYEKEVGNPYLISLKKILPFQVILKNSSGSTCKL